MLGRDEGVGVMDSCSRVHAMATRLSCRIACRARTSRCKRSRKDFKARLRLTLALVASAFVFSTAVASVWLPVISSDLRFTAQPKLRSTAIFHFLNRASRSEGRNKIQRILNYKYSYIKQSIF